MAKRKMLQKFKNLTLDYRSLLALSFVDRLNMSKSDIGQQYLSTLTPDQLENLFPNYYRKQLPPNISKALSGGIPFEGNYPAPGWRLEGTELKQRPEGDKQRLGPSATPLPGRQNPKASPEVKQTWQQKLEELGADKPEGSMIPSGKGLQSWSGAPVAQHRVESITKGRYGKLIEDEAKKLGIDPNVAKAIAHIESGGIHGAPTGSYSGLFQTKGGMLLSPEEHVRDALQKMKTMGENFEKNMGRPPTPTEMYLMHQQGIAGGPAHIRASTTDQEAWKTIRQYYKSDSMAKQAIWGNVPSDFKKMFGNVENISSAQFSAMWASKLQGIPYDQALQQAKKSGVIGQYGPSTEEKKKLEEESKKAATAVPAQPNETGQVFPGQVQPQQIPGAVPPLPEGLNKIITDHIASLPKDKQEQAARNFQRAIERNPNFVTELNQQAEEQQKRQQQSTAEPLPDSGAVRERQKEVAGVRKGDLDPRLRRALDYAAQQTGLDVDVTSGGQEKPFMNNGKMTSPRHNQGKAADFNLIDRKTGKIVSPNDPRAIEFYRHAGRAGVTGGGAGYMTDPNKIHLDIDTDTYKSPIYAGSTEFRSSLQAGKDERKQLQKEGKPLPETQPPLKSPTYAQPETQQTQIPETPPKPIEQRGITYGASIERAAQESESSTTVPQIPNQTGSVFPEKSQSNQVSTPAPAQPAPAPAPAQPAPAPAPAQPAPAPAQPVASGTAQPVPPDENPPPEKKFKYGGQFEGENVTAIGPDGRVLFRANDQEKVSITPKHRIDPMDIQNKTRSRQDEQQQYAQQTTERNEQPESKPQSVQTIPQSNPNLRDMHEFNSKVGQRESPSHLRAMMNATSFGNPINHFGSKSTTTTII